MTMAYQDARPAKIEKSIFSFRSAQEELELPSRIWVCTSQYRNSKSLANQIKSRNDLDIPSVVQLTRNRHILEFHLELKVESRVNQGLSWKWSVYFSFS